MIRQRERNVAPVVQAQAERLPFLDNSFDAALAILTIQHWHDWGEGIREMMRVAGSRVVLLTWDPGTTGFWLVDDYFPKIRIVDERRCRRSKVSERSWPT